MMWETSSEIVVQFTADYPRLFANMEKYIPFINHQLSAETKNRFFMESINNGLIYVYSDLETFKLMNQPYGKDEIEEFKRSHDLTLNPILLTENIINSSTFPENGINFQYKIVSSQKERIIEMLIAHFQSFLGSQVSVSPSPSPKFDLVLNLHTFDCIVLYTNLVSSMYSGILTR